MPPALALCRVLGWVFAEGALAFGRNPGLSLHVPPSVVSSRTAARWVLAVCPTPSGSRLFREPTAPPRSGATAVLRTLYSHVHGTFGSSLRKVGGLGAYGPRAWVPLGLARFGFAEPSTQAFGGLISRVATRSSGPDVSNSFPTPEASARSWGRRPYAPLSGSFAHVQLSFAAGRRGSRGVCPIPADRLGALPRGVRCLRTIMWPGVHFRYKGMPYYKAKTAHSLR
jgi:hypothetical protein